MGQSYIHSKHQTYVNQQMVQALPSETHCQWPTAALEISSLGKTASYSDLDRA